MPIRATALQGTLTPGLSRDLAGMEYANGKLSIRLIESSVRLAAVKFESVEGFRVLDEGDLLEFWPTCSSQHGWLWEIHEGGWFDLESGRSGFVGEKYKDASEYLLTTDNECVSVISHIKPVVAINAL